jgi:DNA-directed RNA polymerase subunit N (RpoN/RPB10)
MEGIEKKVDAMIGESTMNEYKAYKNLVKHKRRINHVFSEISGENSFCSRRPGIDKKAPAIVVVSCSAVPPKAPRRESSKKRKNSTYETSSSAVRPDKTKSLESSKRKRKTSEAISDIEI